MAEEEAARRVRALSEKAEGLRAEAEAYARDTRLAVDAYAQQHRREAEEEARSLLARAEDEARSLRESAESRERTADEEIHRRREELRLEARAFEQRRRQALEALRDITLQLEEVAAEGGSPEDEQRDDSLAGALRIKRRR